MTEDLTDPKNNPLIPSDDPVDPMLTPEGNQMIPADGEAAAALQWPKSSTAAAAVDDVLSVFLKNEVEVEPGVTLARMAGGNVVLVKDGKSTPIEDVGPEDRDKVRAALKRS